MKYFIPHGTIAVRPIGVIKSYQGSLAMIVVRVTSRSSRVYPTGHILAVPEVGTDCRRLPPCRVSYLPALPRDFPKLPEYRDNLEPK